MILKNLTPEQVELIRKFKANYEKYPGKSFCSPGKDCPACVFPYDLCTSVNREERYQAICEYLTELDKPDCCTEIKEIKERLAKLEEERQHPLRIVNISSGQVRITRELEIIQNVMHWNGKDYLKMPDKDYSCAPCKKYPEPDRDTEGLIWFECNGWKDLNDIEITDALARSRTDEQPIWVMCKDDEDNDEKLDKLLGIGEEGYKYSCAKTFWMYARLATVADLKAAGIK